MRKIRLSDTDLELFDIEISPSEFTFYTKHKDAFRTMWREQGKPFWTRYVISFRSFTVKHGVIKQMNIDSPKFENLIDQAFIFIHDQFVDGKEKAAKNFLEDVAKLAQNQDKFPALDSKSFARDPFYLRETRELFRSFFGMPDQKSSYLKVYILCPVFMRFGGSVCRCLERWLVAPNLDDPNDDSYWVQPQRQIQEKSDHKNCVHEIIMCDKCIDMCGEKFFNEKILGHASKPLFIDSWKLGDPRFNDPNNPLFAPHVDPLSDWRDNMTAEAFREFLHYSKITYGRAEDKCGSCFELKKHKEKVLKLAATECRKKTKNGDEREVDLTQLEEFRVLKEKLQQLDLDDFKGIDFEHCTEETALDLSEKLLNLAKDKLPEENHEAFGMEAKETELRALQKIKKQEKKKQRKKANKAQAQIKERSPSPEKKEQDDSDDGEAVEAFKIERDDKKGIISVTVTTSKDSRSKKNGLQNGSSKVKGLPDGVSLTIDLIRDQISGLPKLFEFWEGLGYLIAVINYEEEEKNECEKPTNFTMKVSGVNNKLHENIIVKLLFYVQKRKNRKCLGWNMDADDVVACILPDEDPEMAGLEVNIYRGCFFKAKLTKKERATLKQSIPHRKVLMMLEPKVAQEIRDADNGKERFMNIISQVCSNDSKREKMLRCNNLWDKLLSNPDKFDFVLTVTSARVEELRKIGLRPLDIGYDEFMEMQCPSVTLCRNCYQMKFNCDCKTNNPEDTHFDPEKTGNYMRLITGDQFKVLGGCCTGGSGEDAEHKIELHEIDEDFIKGKLFELGGKCVYADQIPILTKNLLYQPPTPQNKAPAPGPGLSRNINVSFVKGANEQTLSVKLEAYMPEEEFENTEAMLRTIKEEFQKDLTPEQARLVKSIDIEHTPSEPVYCEKHRPANMKSSPSANENSSSKFSPPSATQVASIGLANKFLSVADKNDFKSTGPDSKAANDRSANRTANEKSSASANENSCSKKGKEQKSAETIQMISVESANMFLDGSESKAANGKISPSANEKGSSKKGKEQKSAETNQMMFLAAAANEMKSTGLDSKTANGKRSPSANENNPPFQVKIRKPSEPGPTISIQYGNKFLTTKDSDSKDDGSGSLNELIKQICEQELKRNKEKKRESSGKQEIEKSGKKQESSGKQEIEKSGMKQESSGKQEIEKSGKKQESSGKQEIEKSGKKQESNGKQEIEKSRKKQESSGKQEIEKSGKGKSGNQVDDKQNLKICGHCKTEEPKRKAFKKCLKCKEEGVKDVKYYCGRECQMDDWKNKHKAEHRDGLLA